MNSQPLVSVVCTAYNHQDYIRDALDGFIMQKTSFPFEIIVHDDASSDATPDIVKEYEAKYPSLFRNIYRKENWYSQGKNIWEYIFASVARGKYIAICEGDDYWIDPLKLEKQVSFLEQHAEYSICYHRVKLVTGEKIELSRIPRKYSMTQCDIARTNYINTPSVVFRNQSSKLRLELLSQCITADYVLWLLLSEYGKIAFLPDVMACYRINSGGIWGTKSAIYQYSNWINTLKKLIPKFNLKISVILVWQLIVCECILLCKRLGIR
ncbi:MULTISPECIES: glycosyltransferase [Bacteroides]|jgi:glycosyltransferase involved in cell wall biosynthesis|uniref:glycosyltransferase family 2 protein n=1 Tax=Bacteroides TaxID=816 RepID=UPI000E46C93E|nr:MULTISPECIES: glycosyltransferase [Bacteroides]RHL08516.1 glycosyltransferase [Bacteroides sp. AF39-11AC]